MRLGVDDDLRVDQALPHRLGDAKVYLSVAGCSQVSSGFGSQPYAGHGVGGGGEGTAQESTQRLVSAGYDNSHSCDRVSTTN